MDQTATAPAAEIKADDTSRFINRELSWLDFNFRVVSEAENPRRFADCFVAEPVTGHAFARPAGSSQ